MTTGPGRAGLSGIARLLLEVQVDGVGSIAIVLTDEDRVAELVREAGRTPAKWEAALLDIMAIRGGAKHAAALRRVVRAAVTERRRKCPLNQQARYVAEHLALSECRYESATGTLRCQWGPDGVRLALHVADKRQLNADMMRGPGSITRVGMDVFDKPNEAAVILALEDIVRAAPADAREPERLVHALLHLTVDARVEDRDGVERRGYPTTPAETPGRYDGWGVGVQRIGGRWRLLVNPRTAASKLDRDPEFRGRTPDHLIHLLSQHPGFRSKRWQGAGYRSCRWWMVDVEHLMGDSVGSTST